MGKKILIVELCTFYLIYLFFIFELISFLKVTRTDAWSWIKWVAASIVYTLYKWFGLFVVYRGPVIYTIQNNKTVQFKIVLCRLTLRSTVGQSSGNNTEFWVTVYVPRGFNGSVNISENCNFRSQFDPFYIIL